MCRFVTDEVLAAGRALNPTEGTLVIKSESGRTMELQKPVIIVGAGRSGSTVFHQILSEHPHLAWLSKLCAYFPAKPAMNRLFMQAIDLPLIGKILTAIVHPREYYKFWEHYCKGFGLPCRDLVADDVTNKSKQIRDAFSAMLTINRNRLLLKITGWPRIGFLREIFPDAKFIHVLRDGRAVANSLLNQPWWRGWSGPANWRWGELTASQTQQWQDHNKSFIALAAIEWIILTDAFESAMADLGHDDYLVLKYEDLCTSPLECTKRAAEFCELDWSKEFANSVNRYSLKNANRKWQTDLTEKQQKILNDILETHLRKYEYL
ncbi:MAG: sulfotransferase family protein [Planctomycetota bacterium]|jgi:hypothetical protein